MLSKTNLGYAVCVVLCMTPFAAARERWLERDNRPVFLHPRRFGQEQPAVLQKIRDACPGQVCGTLAGQAVTPLLAAQPECSQQDMADAIIDASKQFDAATQANMIAIAKEYRQAEKNTPPDFTTNPPTLRNSVFCQKAPQNSELNGLVQAQDPANDPNLFFDPATKATVKKGSQPNTFPFGSAGSASNGAAAGNNDSSSNSATIPAPSGVLVADPTASADPCTTVITITVSATNPAATGNDAITVTAGDPTSTVPTVSATAAPTGTGTSSAIGNFGKCSVPQIEFGVGFDNRKETSFRPVDLTSYNHGSAQNIGIITQFICDTLTNSCNADQTAKDTCAKARTAAGAAQAGTGAQADAFNAVFEIQTTFAAIPPVDNQGRTSVAATATAAVPQGTPNSFKASTAGATPTASLTGNANASSGIGSFGKCSVPQIEFGAGFDGRRETSFQPVDKVSYNHGSAQNIGIITRFMCDQLTNFCQADQTAKDTCQKAITAANGAAAGTGAQADAFNAVFNIRTNFAGVQQIDDQGRPVGGNGGQAASTPATTQAQQAPAPAQTNAGQDNSSSGGGGNASGNLQTFTAALGGVTAPVVTATADGKFQVAGNAVINDKQNALVRSCDVQNNKCADAANASGNKNGFTVAACNSQQQQCIAAARSA